MYRAPFRLVVAAALCLMLTGHASAADAPADIAAWMSKPTQTLSPAQRMQLLDDMEKAKKLDGRLLAAIVQQDPSREVKLHLMRKWVASASLKTLSRFDSLLTPSMRDDFELCLALAEMASTKHAANPDYKAVLIDMLVDLVAPIPYPQMPAAGAKVKVPLNPAYAKKRKGPQFVELDAAGVKRLHELVAAGLTHFNKLAGTSIAPGPDFGREIDKWWESKGQGKALAADTWLAKGMTILKHPDQATVVTSTLLGTTGTEWFAAGGFSPDQSIVLAGVSLGPALDFISTKAAVIGADGPAPPAPTPPSSTDARHHEASLFRWSHPQATPFIVRLGADRKIRSVTRLPWASGGVTAACVDAQGNIYIVGPARAGMRKVCGDSSDLPPAKKLEPPADKRSGRQPASPPPPNPDAYEAAYIAKLSPDASKAIWVRFVDNPNGTTSPPDVWVDPDGKVIFVSADVRVLSADGRAERQWDPISRKAVPSEKCAIDPKTGLVAFAGEHHWGTGHEPWRCPYVTISKPDGSPHLTLYNWPGPYIGGATGLVADSPLFFSRFDLNGDLILLGWSDGGNSVLYREPLDVHRAANMRGLGLSGAGVHGALGFGYIVRVSTRTWKVIGGTMLCGRTPQYGPNSLSVHEAREAVDRSLMVAGSSAWGAPQSGNTLCVGHPAGQLIMVLNKECNSLRFSSSMQACGEVIVGGGRWGMATGTLNGKPMALFVTGAVPRNNVYGREAAPPQANPIQPQHAGGHLDGYFTLLDLEVRK